MNKRSFLVIVFASILLVGCMRSTMLPSDLISWVNDPSNGLIKTQSIAGFDFEVLYKPVDYVIAVEGKTDYLTESAYNDLKLDIGGMQYLDLKIKAGDNSGDALSGNLDVQDDYYTRLDYFVTYAYMDIQLVQGFDTLYPALYHFERTYGLTPYSTILLGFENPDAEGDRTLIIDDHALGIGRMKFVFSEQEIKNTPLLKRL